ncbi:MAG: DUF721 domain-containing protein [Brevinematales bacterium]|nr:DUF721 domain-containing protein [Brevinematales bacterium]
MMSSYIKKVLSNTVPPSVLILYSILIDWKEIAGSFFYSHSVPYKFFVKNSELYLACDDPVIATELYLNQKILKSRIKLVLNLEVKTLKTVYDINKFSKFKSIIDHSSKPAIEFYLTHRDKTRISSLVSSVEDDEVKESLQIFFETISMVRNARKNIK